MKKSYPGCLHNHTDYSNVDIRDSINTFEELINYAISLGQEVIAFTEHENVCNTVKIEEYYSKIKKENPNFKVILGNEIYLCRNGLNNENYIRDVDRYWHFILLAKDATGHKQIRELSTRAWKRSYRIGKMTRRPTYYQDLIDIIGESPGHVIGSTACLGGFLARKILQWEEMGRNEDFYEKIKTWLKNMESIFGKGNFFLEMQPSNNIEQITVNKAILNLSKDLDIDYIVTCDAHYLRKEDRPIHKAFLKAQEGEREVDEFYETTYLMNTEELEGYMSYLTEIELEKAYDSILKIKDSCEDYSVLKPLDIPSLLWKEPAPIPRERMEFYRSQIPYSNIFLNSSFPGDGQMIKLIINKLESDKRLQTDECYKVIDSNLKTTWISSQVNNAHWSAYFLNLQKIIEECWNAGTLVGPGRGSGVGFLLLYLLDIIQINPLWETTATYEWRFLNPQRESVLDIDTDIEGGDKRKQALDRLRLVYGEDRVANVVTFGTEKSKSAIQTAARGLGIDIDEAMYYSSLIPSDRGVVRTLSECYYGNPEKGFEPIAIFKREMDLNPELWQVAQRIEGLICRIGEHAGGVIFVDKDFTESTALMRAPNGDLITQFDLHDCEKVSLIKIDLLSVECLDKIHTCLDLLIASGKIQPKATLKETYEEFLGIYKIERNDPEMWKMVWEHKIQSLFQMEQQSGIQGIELIKPKNVDELATLNSVIRLMAPDEGSERPLEQWARYRKNISVWHQEMEKYGLTKDEIQWLANSEVITDGIAEAQESLMALVQDERLGGHTLNFADKCRKGVAKKQGKLFEECERTFYDTITEKRLSQKLAHYVWDVLLKPQRGYGFNKSHTLAYSLVALQEMNLAYKYPTIYWNTACLITDTGGTESQEEDDDDEEASEKKEKAKKSSSKKYDKLAAGINKMKNEGIVVMPPNINTANFTFTPDEKNNVIIFGLRGIVGVGDDVIKEIIANRPFISFDDFLGRTKFKKPAYVSLIKSGALDMFGERKDLMEKYLLSVSKQKTKLNLQNLAELMKRGLLPTDGEYAMARKCFEFTRYLKSVCKNGLDERAINFLTNEGYDDLINSDLTIDAKGWKNIYDIHIDSYRTYIKDNLEALLVQVNKEAFKEEWEKYAKGNYSSWEMDTLCYYYHEHELVSIDRNRYGIVEFSSLPETPVVDYIFKARGREQKVFKLTKICGTCIAKNKNNGTIKLLCTDGVIEVRLGKEFMAIYDKQISALGEDGKKHVVESSWFSRGEKLLVQGFRSGEQFVAKKYSSSVMKHRIMKIVDIQDSRILLQAERAKGEAEDA